MPAPLRLFIAGGTPEERAALREHLAGDTRWRLVSDPAMADWVVSTPNAWTRAAPPVAAASPAATRVSAAPADALIEGLTPREQEVLTLVADGLHNREIAQRLGVSEHTVKFHLGAVFGKLGVSTRTEAVRRGLRLGLIGI